MPAVDSDDEIGLGRVANSDHDHLLIHPFQVYLLLNIP